jgi:hypothetical protein
MEDGNEKTVDGIYRIFICNALNVNDELRT